MVLGAWWYEIVLYGGNGVGQPISDFNRWRHSSSFMNVHSVFSVVGYGDVKMMCITCVKAFMVRS
jgi:hypothetical protein